MRRAQRERSRSIIYELTIDRFFSQTIRVDVMAETEDDAYQVVEERLQAGEYEDLFKDALIEPAEDIISWD